MNIYKVNTRYNNTYPKHVVAKDYAQAEEIFRYEYTFVDITSIDLISTDVMIRKEDQK